MGSDCAFRVICKDPLLGWMRLRKDRDGVLPVVHVSSSVYGPVRPCVGLLSPPVQVYLDILLERQERLHKHVIDRYSQLGRHVRYSGYQGFVFCGGSTDLAR